MKVDKKKIMMAGALILAGFLAILGYFFWLGETYVSTIDARIDAPSADVVPYTSGRLVGWTAEMGKYVAEGESLGTVDGGTASSGLAAPMSGSIVKVNASEGQAVSAGISTAVVADMNKVFISANIEETEVDKVKVGQGVEVRLDAFPGQVFIGRVDTIGGAAVSVFSVMSGSSSNGNYTKVTQLIPITITFLKDYEQDFKLGMNAEIKIHVKSGVDTDAE